VTEGSSVMNCDPLERSSRSLKSEFAGRRPTSGWNARNQGQVRILDNAYYVELPRDWFDNQGPTSAIVARQREAASTRDVDGVAPTPSSLLYPSSPRLIYVGSNCICQWHVAGCNDDEQWKPSQFEVDAYGGWFKCHANAIIVPRSRFRPIV